MKNILQCMIGGILIFSLFSCQKKDSKLLTEDNYDQEKALIIEVLNNETKAAFQRDYNLWQTYWVHEPYVNKSYMNFADSTLSETQG